ncbi:MAG: chromosome segregation protein SMC [SAR324 cluster bacterium]|nr:chromosome segregation protein SMC [SAR324 cluster bacterium]
MSGFKSFCHPIKIEFNQEGITVIVGPNGCGKSNVVDAIRWVLGEQSAKHLRGGGMEDVIFAGSAYQKPVGVAEVVLTFRNLEGNVLPKYRDFSEISVSRKLYRSGESVYMINKTPVRLLDVRELFMDTGIGSKSYAIIEQGKVGEIVSARPLDRRFLVEEAAGIVKFKTKRQTAEKRMGSTMQNLLRVEDILQELSRQEELLRDQVQKANVYIELKAQSERMDQQLSTLRWHKAALKEKEADAHVGQHKKSQASLLSNRQKLEAELGQLSLSLTTQGALLESVREEGFEKEKEIQDFENKRVLEQQNLKNYEEWTQQHNQELEELRVKVANFQEQMDSASHEKEVLEKQHEHLLVEVERIESSRQEESDILHALNEEVQEFQKRLLTIHTNLTNQTNQKGFLEDRMDSLHERHLRTQEQEKNNQQILQEAENKVAQTQTKINDLLTSQVDIQKRLQVLEEKISSQEKEFEANETKLQEMQYLYNKTSSRVESLEKIQNQYEDFDESVKSFLTLLQDAPEDKERMGILGVLAELVQVDPEILPKVAPAMADYLELLVIEKTEHLAEIEKFCRENKIGRLGFIALDRQNNFPLSSPQPSSGVPLNELIQFKKYEELLSKGIFGQIYLFETEEAWQKVSLFESMLEWISPHGSYHTRHGVTKIGQPRQTSLGFLERRSEIDKLTTQIKHFQSQVEELQKKQSSLKQQRFEWEHTVETEKTKQHECELELSRFRKELEHNLLDQRRTAHLGQQLQADVQQIKTDLASNRHKLFEMEENFVQLTEERKQLEAQMERQQEMIQTQRNVLERVSEELLTTRISLTEIYEQLKTRQDEVERVRQEITGSRQRLKTLENSEKELTEKIKTSQQIVSDIESRFDGLLMVRDELKHKLETQTEAYNTTTGKRSDTSTKLQELAKDLDQLMMKIHEESLRVTEQRMQREQIEQQLINMYSRTPEELSKEMEIENLQDPQLEKKLKKIRSQMENMNNINLGAPEEYSALQERMEFLGQQSDDLQKAINDLKQSIREINTESRRRFQETFDQINQNFTKMFGILFEGGEARMVLTEAEDVLEAGVDIIAQPPGKKLQNLNLLSGGEKALTAISLIFAIFLLKPSPFCLLDEVDAPLDDANVGRFNAMIQHMTENSQFIIITHNKKTMEIGDLLYGVTMEEPGVSKTVSVQFQEATGMVN